MKIVIWTGAAYEPWSPVSILKGGIGGSETAAIHMGFELARLGHEVVMFGDHKDEGPHYAPLVWYPENDYRSTTIQRPVPVEYLHYKKGIENPRLLACDVFVSSRDKRALRLKPDCRAAVLWAHDIHCGDDWENELINFDRIYCLSKWHEGYFRGVYPHVPDGKVAITRNGIDVSRFVPHMPWEALAIQKKPELVWSSSPDRGLDVMLDVWPEIKKVRSDAELHIYYGFDTFRRLNEGNPRGKVIVDYLFERVRRTVQSGIGVTYHGRVNQGELALAHMRSMCWAYSTAFLETSCITAMEAQAAGGIPVTTKVGALEETASRGVLIEPPNKSDRYKGAFVKAVLSVLDDWDDKGGWLAGMAPPAAFKCRDWALNELGWNGVAAEWQRDFDSILSAKRAS